ncbi:MAG: carbamoyl-phosphate synthase large subunit [Candidatus Caenarcaniphilales bacterium]|nr:carbamoyl-phosphate synthase large subunit [Candidatus Caenarcaniphilales bacterium]
MPKRTDLKKILVIGAGPIVIGQACEFDYSGTQACKALKAEGYSVILVNSNPATIMTDPELADRTYIEPITPENLRHIIERERPDALLATMGGQTSLNAAVTLAENGTLDYFDVELIGAKLPAIRLAEDRMLFREVMAQIGLKSAKSEIVTTLEGGKQAITQIGFPVILRPAFTLGGSGGGIAYDQTEFEMLLRRALQESPTSQVLLEENLQGWKEFELEVMRDLADNVAIICSIENFDPMGVHTGDSITVAPAQTLSDRDYQNLRNQAIQIIRAVGVECGGSNIQFAVNPSNGEVVVIEMNPRVSRSSALASKATGYPIAKIAAKLAVGYTLDELPNEITKTTSAAFEPSIDYVVTKIPRFAFEKFPGSEVVLGTQMRSVGEVMAVGRTFVESFQKALRGLERGMSGFGPYSLPEGLTKEIVLEKLSGAAFPERVIYLWYALALGASIEEIYTACRIDRWFLAQLDKLYRVYASLSDHPLARYSPAELQALKQMGFSDGQLAKVFKIKEQDFRQYRFSLGVRPSFKMIDTCAGEFDSSTPYYYSCYDSEDEVLPSEKPKIIILGGGPNRIGQGIEFDYCCVHASIALQEAGYETIMVNSNPETVSTDFDISSRLYFEPVTVEDVLAIYQREKPLGVIVQIGGQTPLNIAKALEEEGVRILGTQVQEIARAEDRSEFNAIVHKLNLKQPAGGLAYKADEIFQAAEKVGFPVLVRPSFVLGGQAMQIVYDQSELQDWLHQFQGGGLVWPVLVDQFLSDALEIDVDAVADGKEVLVAGIMEHIERAGIHSGDSSCALPPQTLSAEQIDDLIETTDKLALELGVIGLINVQFAFKEGKLYILEVNPRASRTVPFVSKVTGIAWAKIGALLMVGKNLSELKKSGQLPDYHVRDFARRGIVAVKEVVLPFKKFPGCQVSLGPEMRSTGEVMGIDHEFGLAYAKGLIAAGQNLLSTTKAAFLSVNDHEKERAAQIAQLLSELGYFIYCTEGTFNFLKEKGIYSQKVRKAKESEPNVINLLTERKVSLIISVPLGRRALQDNMSLRRLAILLDLPLITTIAGAEATVRALRSLRDTNQSFSVKTIQEYQKEQIAKSIL